MKKIVFSLLTTVVCAALTGCGILASQPHLPVTELEGAVCEINYSGKAYSAVITNTTADMTTVSFTSPPSLEGMVCTYSSDGCKITFGSLNFYTERPLPENSALPRLIYSILHNAVSENAFPPDSVISEKTTACFRGMADGYSYTLTTDLSTGRLIKISSSQAKLDINLLQQAS